MNVHSSKGVSQLRLFEARELTIDRTFANTQRVHLDATSWIDHVSGWISRHDLALASLAKVPKWEQRSRWMYTREVEEPRLTAEYPDLAKAEVPLLRAMGKVLSQHYEIPYDSVWLNLYRDHQDSTAWHADRPSCKRDNCIVPVVSFGETRRFLARHRDGGPSSTFVVAGGDLIVMGGRCQRDWVHSVPKETQATGMRISVNFGSRLQATPE